MVKSSMMKEKSATCTTYSRELMTTKSRWETRLDVPPSVVMLLSHRPKRADVVLFKELLWHLGHKRNTHASQRIAHNPSEVSEAPTHHPEIISVDDQTTETPSAGAPTSSLALSIHDTMDVDDGGSGIGPVPIPSEGGTPKRQLGHSAPRARPSRSAPSRTVIHPIGVTLPASPMADDLGSIESRLERCKLILTDAWDDLRDLRGRLQLFDDGIYRALLDLESMGKYLEGKDLFAKGSQTP
ncbi:hypothetical protein EDB83DRAFT_2556653 [Lactarius deliciosus]|nr:hypothetical protein EDB83DRAFT_2556653 [Lactarius deliciosus]